jgi:hypothetical protein
MESLRVNISVSIFLNTNSFTLTFSSLADPSNFFNFESPPSDVGVTSKIDISISGSSNSNPSAVVILLFLEFPFGK